MEESVRDAISRRFLEATEALHKARYEMSEQKAYAILYEMALPFLTPEVKPIATAIAQALALE